MVQFNQNPIIEEGLDEMLTDQEKHERIKKALEIHMLDNREAHMKPAGETLFSFTQGDPNAVVGSAHGFAKEEKPQQKSIEEQRMEQQEKFNQSSGPQKAAPIRTCPCCINFLKQSFGLSDKEVSKYAGGLDGGSGGYQGGSSGGSGYDGGSGGGSYAGAGGADYSGGGPTY
jgi:hypothetical protein